MRWLLTFAGFNALLFVAALAALWMFGGFADEGPSAGGWLALGLGTAFTSGIGVALTALVFYSARRDYDEQACRAGRPDRLPHPDPQAESGP